MATIAGLFDDGLAADKALSALATRGFDDVQVFAPAQAQGEPEAADMTADDQQPLDNDANAGQPLAHVGQSLVYSTAAALSGEDEGSRSDGLGVFWGKDVDLPEQERRYYEQAVERGATLVVIETASDRADEARQIMREANAQMST